MMNVSICYTTKVIINYDSRFDTPAVPMSLDKAISTASFEMKTYGFAIADIIDAKTGEVLAIVENDD